MSGSRPHGTWPPLVVVNTSAGTGSPVCGNGHWGSPVAARRLSDRVYALGPREVRGAARQTGNTVAIPTRYGTTYLVLNSSAVSTLNLTVRAASYMAIVEANGRGGHRYEGVKIVASRASSPLAANADAFHSTGCAQGPTLIGCTFHGADDDFFNVHNTLQLAVPAGPNSLWVVDGQLFPGAPDSAYGSFRTWPQVQPGHSVSLFAVNALDDNSTLVRDLPLVEITRVPDTNASRTIVTEAHNYVQAQGKACPLSACGAGLKSFAEAQVYHIVVPASRLPSELPPALWLTVDQFSASHALIQDNTFSGTSCNFGRFKSSHGRIQGNRFSSACTLNLEVGPLQAFMEGMAGITNVTIENNAFAGTGGKSPIHVWQAENVRLLNNSFLP